MRRIQRQQLQRLAAAVSATALCFFANLSALGQVVSDEDIALAVERQIARDAAVDRSSMDIFVTDGVVTLDGTTDTLAARQMAEDIAGIVRGVRSVVNRLRLAPTSKTADDIQHDVETALRVDPVAESYEVDVRTGAGGFVELTGEVESWAERAQIEQSVMTVPGVASIQNELTVESSQSPRGAGEISEEILSRLRWDVRVDDSLINVLVLDGSRVTLSGTVGSLAEKRHAEKLARVAGVTDVYSTQLTVEPWARNDDLRRANLDPDPNDVEIGAAIATALRYDPRVSVENVVVTSRDGHVQLSGSVSNLMAFRAAADDARNTYGVRSVENNLVVTPEGRDDEEIRRLLTNALRGYGLTDANDISVRVSNGVVRLIGDATSALAHWRAESIASAVRGVTEVRNELTIDGHMPTLLTRLYAFDPQVDQFLSANDDGVKTDREIRRDVESELFWSPFVDSDEIDIEVENGVVTLRGKVESSREYSAARENAFEGGAFTVNNELRVSD